MKRYMKEIRALHETRERLRELEAKCAAYRKAVQETLCKDWCGPGREANGMGSAPECEECPFYAVENRIPQSVEQMSR